MAEVVNQVFRDATAIVGVGETAYYRRGQSHPQTIYELAGKAVLAAVADAGLSFDDVDGITYYGYGGGLDNHARSLTTTVCARDLTARG